MAIVPAIVSLVGFFRLIVMGTQVPCLHLPPNPTSASICTACASIDSVVKAIEKTTRIFVNIAPPWEMLDQIGIIIDLLDNQAVISCKFFGVLLPVMA